MEFDMVIGLEVHTELATETKVFCSCSTAFGGQPNTQVCEVCLGMPGSLPVLNKEVVEFAIGTGLATDCTITKWNQFDRKNYFYPDLPKAYQTSQLYFPICQKGHIDIVVNGNKKAIGIKEIHMEEDAGKLIHDDEEGCTMVDYNRAGIPLLEIVSEADFSHEDEVVAYLTKLKTILQYIGVSDCKMEQGSLRVDVNLSVKPKGTERLGTRTEMKNLNSFKAIARAIAWEKNRQIQVIQNGGEVVQETRRWEDGKGEGYSMRSKENAKDYRYFPEPDLPPLEIDDAWIERVREGLPELPEAKKERYLKNYKLPVYDVDMIVASKELVRIFEGAYEVCGNAKEVSHWIMGEVLRMASDTMTPLDKISFYPEYLGKLIVLFKENIITRKVAKDVFEKIFLENVEPERYVVEHHLNTVRDDSVVDEVVKTVLTQNPESVLQYKEGVLKVKTFLMGQCMKALKGKANPSAVTTLLEKQLEEI